MNKEIKKAIKALLSLVDKEEECGLLLVYGEREEDALGVTSGGAGNKRIVVGSLAKSIIDHEEIRDVIAIALASIDPDILTEALNKIIKTKN